MSQSGSVIFFTEIEPSAPVQSLRSLLCLTGASSFDLAIQTLEADDSWLRFRSNSSDPFPPEKDVTDRSSFSNLPLLFQAKSCLRIHLGVNPLVRDLQEAIRRDIAVDIRGNYCPGTLLVMAGYHDLFETAEVEEGHFFSRAFFSLHFWGYSSPSDWGAFRRQVFQLQSMRILHQSLQSIWGTTGTCAYWNI
jgi:hypothetical protein